MSANSIYLATMEKQMQKWDANVDALAAKGEKATSEARADYQKWVKDLRENRAAAQQCFKEMQAAGHSAGDKAQAQVTAAYEKMQKNYEKAVSELRT